MRVSIVAVILLTVRVCSAIHSTPVHLHRWEGIQRERFAHTHPQPSSEVADGCGAQPSFLHLQSSTVAPYPCSDIIQANLTQSLDHFGNSTDATFEQRYWYSLRHYKPHSGKPTPIFVLDSGEVSGSTRLAYLDHGILDILANATDGIGVVLEHRYYGESIPLRSDLGPGEYWGVDQLQWLTTEQALEDNAQFVQKFTFEGVGEAEMEGLRAPNSPVISYGGSYPGGKSAFLRVLYPDLFFGSLASSAVVTAIHQLPQYFFPIADGTKPDCLNALEDNVAYVDSIIAKEERDEGKVKELLSLFGLQGLNDVRDFATVLSLPLGGFQALNWDPSVSSTTYERFCTALVGHDSGPILPRSKLHARDGKHNILPPPSLQGYADFIKQRYVQPCTSHNLTVEQCFGGSDFDSIQKATELTDSNGIAWTFQVCTEWGYFLTAPTSDAAGPRLISSVIDLNFTSAVCRDGFLPGKHFTMPDVPRIERINRYGNFSIAADRLALIDGQFDPWRPATVHSQQFARGGDREDTTDRPFKLIPTCWHHCDENGNRTYEPPRIRSIHAQQVYFVQAWLQQWDQEKRTAGSR